MSPHIRYVSHLGLAGCVDEEVSELSHDVSHGHQTQLVHLAHTQVAHLQANSSSIKLFKCQSLIGKSASLVSPHSAKLCPLISEVRRENYLALHCADVDWDEMGVITGSPLSSHLGRVSLSPCRLPRMLFLGLGLAWSETSRGFSFRCVAGCIVTAIVKW